jgi:hypothetical protein
MYKTFITLAGNSSDATCVIDAAEAFDRVVVTPYIFCKHIWNKRPELEKKCLVYFDIFADTKYEGHDYGWQRSPSELDYDKLELDWNPNDPDTPSWGYSYPMHFQRVVEFLDDIEKFMKETKALGPFLDDHRLTHGWWNMNPEEYALVHPPDLEHLLKTVEWSVQRIIARYRGDEGASALNGEHLLDNYSSVEKSRNWESPGASFQPWNRVIEDSMYGDYLQIKVPEETNYFLACFFGDKIEAYVNLGIPDNKKLWARDESGTKYFTGVLPKDYPWQPKVKDEGF